MATPRKWSMILAIVIIAVAVGNIGNLVPQMLGQLTSIVQGDWARGVPLARMYGGSMTSNSTCVPKSFFN